MKLTKNKYHPTSRQRAPKDARLDSHNRLRQLKVVLLAIVVSVVGILAAGRSQSSLPVLLLWHAAYALITALVGYAAVFLLRSRHDWIRRGIDLVVGCIFLAYGTYRLAYILPDLFLAPVQAEGQLTGQPQFVKGFPPRTVWHIRTASGTDVVVITNSSSGLAPGDQVRAEMGRLSQIGLLHK